MLAETTKGQRDPELKLFPSSPRPQSSSCLPSSSLHTLTRPRLRSCGHDSSPSPLHRLLPATNMMRSPSSTLARAAGPAAARTATCAHSLRPARPSTLTPSALAALAPHRTFASTPTPRKRGDPIKLLPEWTWRRSWRTYPVPGVEVVNNADDADAVLETLTSSCVLFSLSRGPRSPSCAADESLSASQTTEPGPRTGREAGRDAHAAVLGRQAQLEREGRRSERRRRRGRHRCVPFCLHDVELDRLQSLTWSLRSQCCIWPRWTVRLVSLFTLALALAPS